MGYRGKLSEDFRNVPLTDHDSPLEKDSGEQHETH